MSAWAQFGLFAAALVGIGYFGWGLMGALGRIGDYLRVIVTDLVETQNEIARLADYTRTNVEVGRESLANYIERYPTVEQQNEWARKAEETRSYEAEALDAVLRGQQVAFSKAAEALLHRLDAIAEALDDKKVRVMNIPTYSGPQNPAPAPQKAPQQTIRADDPRLQTFFGQIQAAGEQKRRLEAESERLREQIAAEKALLADIAAKTELGAEYKRPTEGQRASGPEETDERDRTIISDTAFDDVMRRLQAQKDRQ